MSEVQPEIPLEANHHDDDVEKPNSDSVTDDLIALEDVSPSKDIAVVKTSNDRALQTSAQQTAPVLSQSPLQGLEEAARQASPQHVLPVANVQHGHHPQQAHPIPTSNARLLAPAPARGHVQQPVPPPFNAPAASPQIFYPQQPGTPLLMNQCPRCGLRAGEPFQPMQFPNGPYYQPYIPDVQHPPLQKKQNTASRASRAQPQSRMSLHPPPPNHPNVHLWVPPPGYVPQLPAQTPPPATGSTYSAVTMPPETPSYPPRKNPNRSSVLPPHIVSSRLPSPPPASRPLTLVEDENRDIKGRRRKSSKPYRRRMSRDERRDILLMRRLGYKLEQIARYIGATVSAVNYTVRQGDAEPKHKKAGRRVRIPEELIDNMVAYVKDYMEREKVCPVDKRTGRKTMKHLSYKMIRQAVFADENGEIPAEYKYSDDALKTTLNKRGVFLRAPMSQAMIEIARARGKKMWQEKLERDRLAAETAAAAGTVVAEQGATAEGGYVDAGELSEEGEDDEDMEDASGDDDAISIPSDAEDGHQDDDGDEGDIDAQRGFSNLPPRPLSTLTSFGN